MARNDPTVKANFFTGVIASTLHADRVVCQDKHMPDKQNTQKDAGIAEDKRPRPSQAEGEDRPGKSDTGERPRPSQAEGEDNDRP
jgi:hypothetical protein